MFSRSWVAHALWLLGYSDQALTRSHEALVLARELSHPFSLASALDYAAVLHQFRRERHAVQERAEAAIALCREQGFAYYSAWATVMEGWAQVAQGYGEAGLAQCARVSPPCEGVQTSPSTSQPASGISLQNCSDA